MVDEVQPQPQSWERMAGEPERWFRRFDAFRLLKPVRSVSAIFQQEEKAKNSEKQRRVPPGEWHKQARRWKWEERAAAFDAYQAAELEVLIAAEKAIAIKTGYALMHKRLNALNGIVSKLIGYLKDESNVWLPDVKAIGTGPNARQVDLIRFNEALFAEIRNYLEDIAKEMGERVQTKRVAVTEFPKVYLLDEDGTFPEVGVDKE